MMSGAPAFRAALRTISTLRLDRLAAPVTRGLGAIIMLHQVCPPSGERFEPSRILQITPDFLEAALSMVRSQGFDFIALDDLLLRISTPTDRPFVAFTLDDGYRDNLEHAAPIFARFDAPYAIYLPDSFADGKGDLWWLTLEAVLRKRTSITFDSGAGTERYDLADTDAKVRAHSAIYWALRARDERTMRATIAEWAAESDIDPAKIASDLLMGWDEIREIAGDPLCTIGAHTTDHLAIAKLPADEMRDQIVQNRTRLTHELGVSPRHFSYPYGDPGSAGPREFAELAALGFETAVTTRKGMIFADHAAHVHALPRLSLNGDFQDLGMLRALLSGLPFALRRPGRLLDVG
ncbi:MAG: polysaccharide deacetylase family protein [Pseudomonadota bacterium]